MSYKRYNSNQNRQQQNFQIPRQKSGSSVNVIRLKPYFYIHVRNKNTNVTSVVVGPKTFTRKDHQIITQSATRMVMVPPRHYCRILNPVLKVEGEVQRDEFGNVKLRHGCKEIRFEQDPFPLYPGEFLDGSVTRLQVVAPDTALVLKAIDDIDEEELERKAGEMWLFKGPATYKPRVDVEIVEVRKAMIIKENQALQLKAKKGCVDSNKIERVTGEEWLVKESGAYICDVNEDFRAKVSARILTEKKALHLRALRDFTDAYKQDRKAGEEWLVTLEDTSAHIQDVYEDFIREIRLTTLNNRQYCFVLDPIDKETGQPRWGERELRSGPCSFFLQPGEQLLSPGIRSIHVLPEHTALLLRARATFSDVTTTEEGEIKAERKAGSKWMIHGPCEYIPNEHVELLWPKPKPYIPLDKNEGIYVRDKKTGKVEAITGKTYCLKPHQELWEKHLPAAVERLLEKVERTANERVRAYVRDKTRVVTYRAPHNSAVQIYDYKQKKARVVFGPELVMLGPDEHFTLISLSGGKPKRPHQLKSLGLLLGPDFMTDLVTVETADHARLNLQLAYNWQFRVDKTDPEESSQLFSVPDFVGSSCKAIASKIRGAVASSSFDQFHKNSAAIIKEAIFGEEAKELAAEELVYFFETNRLEITNIDIQSVEPVDQRTRDALQKSVQLAIEITTKSQEASALQEAQSLEQKAKGKLERQKIIDEALAEKRRKNLLEQQAGNMALESTGQAAAEAKAKAEASKIEGEAALKRAELKANALKIESKAKLDQNKKKQDLELTHKQQVSELALTKQEKLAAIEAEKFQKIVQSIGAETIGIMSKATFSTQTRLLKALGLTSLMFNDPSSPLSLLTGNAQPKEAEVIEVEEEF